MNAGIDMTQCLYLQVRKKIMASHVMKTVGISIALTNVGVLSNTCNYSKPNNSVESISFDQTKVISNHI